MSKILLTGGRAPVTLALARLLAQAKHTVVVAESAPYHLCRNSRAVQQCYHVPPPKTAPVAYIDALAGIIRRERIEYLIPTCEEIFYIAQGRDQLAGQCRVLVDTLPHLHAIHNKWTFVQMAQTFDLLAPSTLLLTSPTALRALGRQLDTVVLKPVYSRFATATRLPPHSANSLGKIVPTSRLPWIAQTYIPGDAFCTYSVAHQGRLLAHATYPVTFKAGQGAAIVFEACEHPQALAWVQRFVHETSFHGQIAFDFIQHPSGKLFAIECNPRATSGVHLFEQDLRFVDALLGKTTDLITPLTAPPRLLTLAMLLYGLPSLRSRTDVRRWIEIFWQGRDVIFQRNDPWPWFAQFASLWQFWRWSRQYGVGLVAATTLDIEWNGELNAECELQGNPLGAE